MNRLRKSNADRVLFGVCGGIGRYFEIDPVLVRAVFIVLFLAGGSGLIGYIILAIVMPGGEQVETNQAEGTERTTKRRQGLAAALIIIGAVVLLANLGIFGSFKWEVLWPLLLIGMGAAIIAQQYRRSS
ncbi:MAG: PspC domain-containing protein [Dehalococcoidia bacterium]